MRLSTTAAQRARESVRATRQPRLDQDFHQAYLEGGSKTFEAPAADIRGGGFALSARHRALDHDRFFGSFKFFVAL